MFCYRDYQLTTRFNQQNEKSTSNRYLCAQASRFEPFETGGICQKSLNATEHRYANNECELLAVLTGLKRFHYYASGRTIHVITDSKSLVNIMQRNLAEIPARLQRIVCQMHQYDMVLHYRKGESLLLSDYLSRNPEYEKNMGSYLEDLETRLDGADIAVSTYIPQSALEEIAQATKSDVLRDVTKFIIHGWPGIDAGLPEDLQLYYSPWNELTYHAGCMVKGNRVVVPEALRILQTTQSPSGHVKNGST